jgi:hypothetical protein
VKYTAVSYRSKGGYCINSWHNNLIVECTQDGIKALPGALQQRQP